MANAPGVMVNGKVRWVQEQFPSGSYLRMSAPGAGAMPFPCFIASLSGKDNTDVTIDVRWLPGTIFPQGSSFELIDSSPTGMRVVAEGVIK